MASEEKTARAIVLISRWCSCSALGSGPPDEEAFQRRVHGRSACHLPDGPVTSPGCRRDREAAEVLRCTSSSWDAAGWAASSPARWRRTATPWPSSTRTPAPSAGSPRASAGRRWSGFGFDRDHLLEAGIDEAGALAAVTNGDNSNILTARIARENFGIERVVARIYDPRRAVIYQRLGIPTVATVSWATDQVLRRLLPGEVQADWVDPSGQGLRRRAGPAGRLGGQEAGRAQRAGPVLADGRHPARRGPHRHRRRRRPGGRRRSSFMAATDALDALPERLEPGRTTDDAGRHRRRRQRRPVHRQRPGRWPATTCCSSSRTRAWSAVRRRPCTGPRGEGGSIEWRTADACEVTSLREADIGEVDVVVAATGDDEDNLVISLLAKQEFAVPRVVARVNHPKNEWLFNENWGVDVSVSTPHLILALTEEAVSVGQPGPPAPAGEGAGPAGGGHPGRRLPGHRPSNQGARSPPRRDLRGRGAGGARGGPPGRHRLPGRRRGDRPGDAGLRGRDPPDADRRSKRSGLSAPRASRGAARRPGCT